MILPRVILETYRICVTKTLFDIINMGFYVNPKIC